MRIEEVVSGIRAILAMRLVKDHGFNRKRVAEVLGDEPADDNPSPEREGGLVIREENCGEWGNEALSRRARREDPVEGNVDGG
jgi:hypothetical protein